MVVDPGVRQAYTVKDAKDLYNTQWVGFPFPSFPWHSYPTVTFKFSAFRKARLKAAPDNPVYSQNMIIGNN